MTVTPSDTSTEALNQDAISAEAELDFAAAIGDDLDLAIPEEVPHRR